MVKVEPIKRTNLPENSNIMWMEVELQFHSSANSLLDVHAEISMQSHRKHNSAVLYGLEEISNSLDSGLLLKHSL